MKDLSSYSKPDEVVTEHLDWKISIDFDTETLKAEAIYTVRVVTAPAVELNLDTNHLKISEVKLVDTGIDDVEIVLDYTLHPIIDNKAHLGRRLEIDLSKTRCNGTESKGMTCKVSISYETTKLCSGLQWLPPSQTAGKKYPYLFTQCQAIHARSLVPCQDRPGIKITYAATVTVPHWSTCVMSAVLQQDNDDDTPSPSEADDDKTNTKMFHWKQPVPVSSYLLALAVGELSSRKISDRSAVWSEPSVVDAAAYEFSETEDFLNHAEDISGLKYQWGRYDLLCLPPSFPYGGMENPCLTFVTPTLLAGDKSLADVVAHEIAHSWTGNLVTCATWDHFWLNEGWTMWLQRKIMVRMKNDPTFLDFDAIDGRKALQDTVEEFICENVPQNTRLVLDGGDGDPDDSYSTVSYEKGFTFLLYLERMIVGTDEFEKFFHSYIAKFASKTLTSDDFKSFFVEHFNGHPKLKNIDWDMWYHSEGMPPVSPPLDQTLAKASTDLAQSWYDFDNNNINNNTNDDATNKNKLDGWSSGQITCFLDALQSKTLEKPLKVSTLTSMNDSYKLAQTKNSEILFRYCQLAIAAEDERVLPIVVRFITTQGRMKYVRPLYKSLYKSLMGKSLAVDTFLKHKDFYHPIATKMIAIDLKVAMTSDSESSKTITARELLGSNKSQLVMGAIAVAVASITLAFVRSSKRK